LGYAGVMILAFVVINFLTAGFLLMFMKIKGARGKQIVTNIYAVNRNYIKPGIVDNGFYIYKDGNGHEKRMKIPKNINIFYRFLNVTWVNVDEEKNVFITPDGKEISGFDAEKYNNLYLRTLYRPAVMDQKQQIMFILIIVTALLSLITVGILGFVVIKKLDLILANTQAISQYFIGLNATVI
jgi:hypothetical protein